MKSGKPIESGDRVVGLTPSIGDASRRNGARLYEMVGCLASSFFFTTVGSGDGWIGGWAPGIGDPTLVGWLTVVLYLVAAWASQRTARVGRAVAMHVRERLFWLGLAVVLGLLALNKQLDLQSALTELGRILANEQGWYEERRLVQIALVGGLGVGAVATTVTLAKALRGAPTPTYVAIGGIGLLGLFVVVRASSFHHVDRLIGDRWLGLKANWILEIGGILTVTLGAKWRRVAPARTRARVRRT